MAQKQQLNRSNVAHTEDMFSVALYVVVLVIIGAAIFFTVA